MWKQVRSAKDVFPPPAMGKFGMSKNRFIMMVKLAGEAYPLNETGMDDSDGKYYYYYCLLTYTYLLTYLRTYVSIST